MNRERITFTDVIFWDLRREISGFRSYHHFCQKIQINTQNYYTFIVLRFTLEFRKHLRLP
jgi:hypothetical protein